MCSDSVRNPGNSSSCHSSENSLCSTTIPSFRRRPESSLRSPPTLDYRRKDCRHFHLPWCRWQPAWLITMKIGSGKPVVGATLVVARSQRQPVFIPLETISKWQVAIGDGTTGVRTQAAAIRCSSTPFCRSVPEQHGTWRAMLESVPQPTGAQDTACAQNRPTSPRRCVGCVADSRVWRRLDDPKDCHTPCPSTGAVGHPW